jgi:hypothetical protein
MLITHEDAAEALCVRGRGQMRHGACVALVRVRTGVGAGKAHVHASADARPVGAGVLIWRHRYWCERCKMGGYALRRRHVPDDGREECQLWLCDHTKTCACGKNDTLTRMAKYRNLRPMKTLMYLFAALVTGRALATGLYHFLY